MVIGATGHRPHKLGGYGDDRMELLIGIAETAIDGYGKVISGMALGWDTAVAIAAVRKGIPFIAAVPFIGQESRWPEESRNVHNNLLDLASEVVIISPGGYTVEKMQVRNEWMVDRSDVILALWDGSPGGTGNCIRYAIRKKKPIKNVWPVFERTL
jgi:uncharacterized phage-like protein YoqJ